MGMMAGVVAIMNAAIYLRDGEETSVQRGELASVGMEALALDNRGETAVEIPKMGRSKNLVEQAE